MASIFNCSLFIEIFRKLVNTLRTYNRKETQTKHLDPSGKLKRNQRHPNPKKFQENKGSCCFH
jgi:hypothetical protein